MATTVGSVAALSEDGLRKLIEPELEQFGVPGVEVAVVRGGEVLFAGGFGLRDMENGLPVTPSTVFHHGSTGKAFTCLLVAALVDDGVVELDRPVRQYLPEFRLADPVASDRVTIRDLLSHRSGLARHDLMWIANPSWPTEELVRRLRHLEMGAELRSEFQYCNLGYATVGAIIAEATGSSWAEEVRHRVLEPLGMLGAVTSTDEMQGLANHAEPYIRREGRLGRTGNRSITATAPAGQLMYCAEDSARWLRFQAANGELDGRRVAAEATFAQTRSIQIPVTFPGLVSDQPEWGPRWLGYGLGWVLGAYRDRPMIWHSGGIDGFYTEVLVLTDDEAGVLVSANLDGSLLTTAVLYTVADLLLVQEPRPWFERMHALGREADEEAREARAGEKVVAGTTPSRDAGDFAGAYEHPGYGALHVVPGSGTDLVVKLGELDVSATHRHFDTWTARYEALDVTFAMTFVAAPDGSVAEVRAEFEPGTPIVFTRTPGEGGTAE